MDISVWNVIGIVLVLVLIIGVGVYSGRKVSDASDFTTGGGKAGAWLVCGSIMGSLVSGQATIGTAQLAFTYGMSAWWFTLGAGIGCLLLGIGYVIPLRHSGNVTLLQVIGNAYGAKAESVGSVLCSIGIFISVIAQILAACALITTIAKIPVWLAAVISAAIMACYVIFGGAWGAGMGGIVKLILLSLACVLGLIMVFLVDNGFTGFTQSLKEGLVGTGLGRLYQVESVSDLTHRFGNLLSRGFAKDIGSGISLIVGVLATQTYAQAIWSGKSDDSARKGAFLSALLIPPIGIACTCIGLFMRGHFVTVDEVSALKAVGEQVPAGMELIDSAAQAFPVFVEQYMPPVIGGIVLGTLLITVVGGGAGLSLGVATIIMNDIVIKIKTTYNDSEKRLKGTRCIIILTLSAGTLVAVLTPGAIINDFGFLSMGLRGAVVFFPLSFALFIKRKAKERWIIASMVGGTAAALLWQLLKWPGDSLYPGMGVALLGCLIAVKKRQDEIE